MSISFAGIEGRTGKVCICIPLFFALNTHLSFHMDEIPWSCTLITIPHTVVVFKLTTCNHLVLPIRYNTSNIDTLDGTPHTLS